MSDRVTCERCGTPGYRTIGRVAPETWWFGSFTFDSEGSHPPGDFLLVYACSVECRDALWTQQAGHRWSSIEMRVNVREELRRAARVAAARLRATAVEISETAYPTGEDGSCTAARTFARLLNNAAGALLDSVETEIDLLDEATH